MGQRDGRQTGSGWSETYSLDGFGNSGTLMDNATLCLLFSAAACSGASASAGLECVKALELPRYSFIARRAPQGGTVRAVVKLGASGGPTAILTPGADANLAAEVREALTEETRYLDSCRGKELELVFTFRLEGEAREYPETRVEFQTPNQFIITSQPKKVHVLIDGKPSPRKI
jgi:hypothetical protein